MTGPRFAALGDSLTSGIGDPVGDGLRGWAALLAGEGAVFRDFAVSGALTADVEQRQAPAALDFGADIASVVVGVDDTPRAAFDIEASRCGSTGSAARSPARAPSC
ncbi:GDSL-type esterase/lipase family protein [Streptomyces sp. NBC_01497]|uniref:GDSL-type esterase/lipase family protein n=1 Tax=Streptomyces sp. NBC_01497 TaxID=2903885 RepID=UPI002E330853|nr:GDSL-type esterase/lipase family protein [Streptomyces sp. NBC_01497]